MAPETHHSTSEVGHAVNVAHFQELITGCESIGATYDPANSRLSTTDMTTQLTAAQDALLAVQHAKSELIIEINERQEAFEGLKKLSTRVINALIALTPDPRVIADARAILNKIQGNRAREQAGQDLPEEETHHLVSTSQQSYANQVQHFSALIELLRVVPEYSPNEGDLRLPALESYLQQMQNANARIQPKYFAYQAALDHRDQLLYDPVSGLIETSKKVKSYVKSIFGTESPVFKTLNEISFKTFNRS